MEIKQSWVMTCAKGKLSLYEVRILTKIIEYCHNQVRETHLARNMTRLKTHCGDVRMSIPMRYILTDGSNHYEDVYEGARNLCKRTMEFYDSERKEWHCSSLIYNVIHSVNKGIITFTVFGSLLDELYNYTHGYSRYDLEQTMSMRLPSSVRLMWLMYGQLEPKSFSIDWLKNILGVSDKYGQTADFIKKQIAPACEEISERSSIKLSYERMWNGRKVTGIMFHVTRKPQPEQNISSMTAEMKQLLQKDISEYMTADGGFTYRELSANKGLMKKLMEHPAAIDIVRSVTHRARKQQKGKGWIIAALKSELLFKPDIKTLQAQKS